MPTLDLDQLLHAVSPGGPSCLSSTTELQPAGGPHSSVAPAKYTGKDARGNDVASYAYEQRFLDGSLRHTVLMDSKQSQLNRVEQTLQDAVDAGGSPWARLPHLRVTYGDDSYTDLTLPHRAYDGHLRAGTVEGQPTTQHPLYRALRDATPLNARPLLEASPVTLVFGGWDASRKSRQGRWRSALVGEIIGFLAVSTDGERPKPAMRGGARVDPVGMQVRLDGAEMQALADAQRSEISANLYEKAVKSAKKASPDKPESASMLGLGGIPPTLDQLAGVACGRILRTHVLSFAALRQMRFGVDPEGDAACRALLAALGLAGLARADAELYLRANCDLVEAGPTQVRLDQRGGQMLDLEPLGIEEADALLLAALERAETVAGIDWHGLVLDVVGNPTVVRGAVEDETGDGA
jgi:CRISPR-associated protein Csb1